MKGGCGWLQLQKDRGGFAYHFPWFNSRWLRTYGCIQWPMRYANRKLWLSWLICARVTRTRYVRISLYWTGSLGALVKRYYAGNHQYHYHLGINPVCLSLISNQPVGMQWMD